MLAARDIYRFGKNRSAGQGGGLAFNMFLFHKMSHPVVSTYNHCLQSDIWFEPHALICTQIYSTLFQIKTTHMRVTLLGVKRFLNAPPLPSAPIVDSVDDFVHDRCCQGLLDNFFVCKVFGYCDNMYAPPGSHYCRDPRAWFEFNHMRRLVHIIKLSRDNSWRLMRKQNHQFVVELSGWQLFVGLIVGLIVIDINANCNSGGSIIVADILQTRVYLPACVCV